MGDLPRRPGWTSASSCPVYSPCRRSTTSCKCGCKSLSGKKNKLQRPCRTLTQRPRRCGYGPEALRFANGENVSSAPPCCLVSFLACVLAGFRSRF